MDKIRNELGLLARELSDLDDTQCHRVLAIYPHLSDDLLVNELLTRIANRVASLRSMGIRFSRPASTGYVRRLLKEEF